MNTTGKLIQLSPTHSDFHQILDLDREQFPRPWSSKDWIDLNWDHHLLYGWCLNGQTVGFALFSLVTDDDVAHLLKICLRSDLRGQGISQQFWDVCLLKIRERGAKTIYLEVESHNHKAIGFYKKLNFETLRVVKSYYSDGTDAITMQITT
jgi:ribosomal protein S18 acetylase RimI-like enzyme